MQPILKFVLRNLVAPASLPASALSGTVTPACPEPRRASLFTLEGPAPAFRGTGTLACALGFSGNADLLIGSYSVFVGAQHCCAPSRHNLNHSSFRAESAERGIPLLVGLPSLGFAFSWVCLLLSLPFLILSSRPEQRRLLPLRSAVCAPRALRRGGGIMARPNGSPHPVIPNGVRAARLLRPVRFVGARNAFPSHAFCAMNLLFLPSLQLAHTPSRSPLSCN